MQKSKLPIFSRELLNITEANRRRGARDRRRRGGGLAEGAEYESDTGENVAVSVALNKRVFYFLVEEIQHNSCSNYVYLQLKI